jgi:hypothetical protein
VKLGHSFVGAIGHADGFPEFRPHRLLPCGHAQTLAGFLLPPRGPRYPAVPIRVALPDGDALMLHDACPPTWTTGDRVVLLMHGLAGCHRSPYMVRVSGRLFDRGVRAFRMDLRGCGAGEGLARHPYHAGRSDDVLTVVELLQRLCPGSPIALVGFSLSGNIVLKFLGEAAERVPSQVDRAMAINPPIDLLACVQALERWENRVYDRYFAGLLHRNVMRLQGLRRDVSLPARYARPQRLFAFDDRYTAPLAGFADAHTYYARTSAAQFLATIRATTLILTARDDPLVPVESFERLTLPDPVSLVITSHGGHLGYIARRGPDADRRWLDWRIVDWATRSD